MAKNMAVFLPVSLEFYSKIFVGESHKPLSSIDPIFLPIISSLSAQFCTTALMNKMLVDLPVINVSLSICIKTSL